MILSDNQILELRSFIKPFNEKNVGPASYDVTLSSSYLKLYSGEAVTELGKKPEYTEIISPEYVLPPGEFVLASTQEYIKTPNNIAAKVEGRSGIGRLGLFIQNAGYIDPGFEGTITLELFNASNRPIILKKDQRIGQLVFEKLTSTPNSPYRGHYQGQAGATGSRVYQDRQGEHD